MDKLKMKSPDGVELNIERIARLFPGCITETRAEDGAIKRAVDFDLLRQELSADLIEGPVERYQLNWPGKRQAIATANAPIARTLRPCRDESVDFDTTGNLYIEGDNLDVLKLLQETYLGKVKMIYIDPPYNTGKDFIYKDNFTADKEAYEAASGQRDEMGNRLLDGGKLEQNLQSNGRYHSDWLSMMLPRLRLARNLLRDDGVIFISIDDNEVHNLRKICDEIFGADNFIAEFIWKSKLGKVGTTSTISATHEYIICFAKQSARLSFKMIEKASENRKENLRQWGQADRREDRPSMFYPITIDGIEVLPIKDDGTEGRWRIGQESANELLDNGFFELVKKDTGYNIYRNFPAGISTIPYDTLLLNEIGTSAKGTFSLKLLGLQKYFDYPKSCELVEFLVMLSTNEDDIVLDFFSGSSTTAHAVMQLNAEDGGNRKFIMVQIPEACDEKSEAFKAGYKNICEIGKERIRRAGQKIKEELAAKAEEAAGGDEQPKLFDSDSEPSAASKAEALDIGFRVLKLDSSNMRDVYYTPDKLNQDEVGLFTAHIKEDRKDEDLLFQVLLDWGIPLSARIEQKTIDGKPVYLVNATDILACFAQGITEETVKQLAAFKPLRAVFRDDAFDDCLKINVEQIFKVLSPNTEVKAI